MQCATDWRKNTEMQYYRIEISYLAEEDLEKAADYIAFELSNPSAAERTVKGIRAQINKLRNFPKRYELDDDPLLAGLGIRKTYYKEYKAYFIVDDNEKTVHIIRILHMLVDSRAWLYATFGIE